MAGVPKTLISSNLSLAWGQALLEVLDQPGGKCSPLVVSIGGFSGELPPEDKSIRTALDRFLKVHKCNSCDISAMVVFPYKLWLQRQHLSCEEFCKVCVRDLYPRLKALNSGNRLGTYFTRMMAYEGIREGKPVIIDQVSEIVDRLKGSRRFRATGLQMTCFDPAMDHGPQSRLGFPCLQHVGVTNEGENGIAVTGFYPSQHIFDRAYGNYLGLAHLGRFLSYHSGRPLHRVNCIATRPMLGTNRTKSSLAGLKSLIESRMEEMTDNE